MFGKATLEIPASGSIGHSRTKGLSDRMALVFGRIAATTLSEQDGHATVTLESGEVRVIGFDTVQHAIVTGRLNRS